LNSLNFKVCVNLRKNAFKTLIKGYDKFDASTLHTRKGQMGSHQEDLNQDDIDFLSTRMDEVLSPESKKSY
jgi:hypothetical protein